MALSAVHPAPAPTNAPSDLLLIPLKQQKRPILDLLKHCDKLPAVGRIVAVNLNRNVVGRLPTRGVHLIFHARGFGLSLCRWLAREKQSGQTKDEAENQCSEKLPFHNS